MAVDKDRQREERALEQALDSTRQILQGRNSSVEEEKNAMRAAGATPDEAENLAFLAQIMKLLFGEK
jgi:hypothetical protein